MQQLKAGDFEFIAEEFIDSGDALIAKNGGDETIISKSAIGEYEITDYMPQPPVIEQLVPDAIRNAQARLALRKAGLLERVLAEIEAMEEPHRTDAKIVCEYEQNIRRDNPLVLSLGALLGLNSKQLDDLFILATTL